MVMPPIDVTAGNAVRGTCTRSLVTGAAFHGYENYIFQYRGQRVSMTHVPYNIIAYATDTYGGREAIMYRYGDYGGPGPVLLDIKRNGRLEHRFVIAGIDGTPKELRIPSSSRS